MRSIFVGDVTIESIIERDGAWRAPAVMFPAYDPTMGQRHLKSLPSCVDDSVKEMLVITYQTFVGRIPRGARLLSDGTRGDC